MKSTLLVDQLVNGSAAKLIIDSLVEELPPLPALYTSIRRELPHETQVRIEETTVYITAIDTLKPTIHESVYYLQFVYPELEFVIESK